MDSIRKNEASGGDPMLYLKPLLYLRIMTINFRYLHNKKKSVRILRKYHTKRNVTFVVSSYSIHGCHLFGWLLKN